MNSDIKKYELKNLSPKELEELFAGWGEPAFRSKQLFNWMYNNLASDFSEMLNFSKPLRNRLAEECELISLKLEAVQSSSNSGTKKFLFATKDNRKIESVLIPDKNRNTLCISTQAGCPLDCKFCATGLMGFIRNLTAAEIVDQYILAAKNCGENGITNIVYMGMGEPLINFDNSVKSLEIFTHEYNIGLSRRKITLSTSGIPHRIKELAERGLRIKLALSLHSCFEDIRSKIMPINKKYSLAENIDAIKYYTDKTKTRITYEYTMLKGINDRPEDIDALVKLCRKIPSKINLIPFNSIAHMAPDGISAGLEPTPLNKIGKFAEELSKHNITVILRNTQGSDIAAACGQLAGKE